MINILSDRIQSEFEDEDFLLHTYVDSDFYTPRTEVRCCTSTRTSKHLERGVDMLPIHNLNTTATLPYSAMSVHDRISRDDPFEIMYIMAATDLNTLE